MKIAYAKLEDMFSFCPFLTEETENSKEFEAGVQDALLDASRLFETETFVEENFYAKTDGIATIRKFYPNGTMFLRLPPFTEIIEVKDDEGEIVDAEDYNIFVPDFQIMMRWYTMYCGRKIAPVHIEAKWGFPCVPESVKVAVKHWAALEFLTSPLGRKGLVEVLTERQESRLRQTYNRINAEWQYKIKRWRNVGVA